MSFSVSFAQDVPSLLLSAKQSYAEGDYAKAAALYEEVLKREPNRNFTLVDAAAAYARAGKPNEAFVRLDKLARGGFDNAQLLLNNPAFAPMQADERWKTLMSKLSRNHWSAESGFMDGWAMRTPYSENLSDDEKIAGLSKLWSEVKYNFANFHLVPDLRWDAVYMDYLPRVRASKSTFEYYNLLREIVAMLKDGHTNMSPPPELAPMLARPTIRTKPFGDRVIISVASEESKSLGAAPGAEVLEIDGVPVREYVERYVVKYVAASSPQDRKARSYGVEMLVGPMERPVELTLALASGERKKVSLKRYTNPDYSKVMPRNATYEFRMLPGNVAYVAIKDFVSPQGQDGFSKDFEQISASKALVIDIRDNIGGNDSYWYGILGSLVKGSIPTNAFATVQYRPIGRAHGGVKKVMNSVGSLPAGTRYFDKPVAMLINPQTFSAAEDFLVAFHQAKRGPIVGEPSGGSSGQPVNFNLPAGISARVCVMRMSYPDGRPFIGVGVQPTHPVAQTVEDFRAGKDTVLDAALQVLAQEAK